MNMKAFQIMLVVAGVLCAIGIGASIGERDTAIPEDFRPPPWLSALEGLAS